MNHTIYPDRKLNLCHNMKHQVLSVTLALAALTMSRSAQAQREIEIGGVSGFKDTPMEPGGKWHVHDPERPQPPIVAPGTFSTQERPGSRPPMPSCCLMARTFRNGGTRAASRRRGGSKRAR